MAQPLQLRRVTLLLRRTHHRPTTLPPPRFLSLFTKQPFSTTSTPYPLQYELIISRPIHPPPPHRRRHLPPKSHPQHSNQPQESNIPFEDFVDARLNKLNNLEKIQENGQNEGFNELDKRRMRGSDIEDFKQPQENNIKFEGLVDERLNKINNEEINQENGENECFIELDKRKRKYYNKRRRRMMGSDTEDEEYRGRGDDEFVELKQEVVELKTLHKREEKLYFYDAFAYPWEKDKHYKMVYQLEKKYFPDQGFDKAFLDPGKRNADERKSKRVAKSMEKGMVENKMVFFEDKEKEGGGGDGEDGKVDVSEKKVGEFFKCLKKVPGEDAPPEPFLSSRRTGLPAQWDTPTGTVLLVNKPKGWTSFTVCGKLRRLVKVKKVGHPGTLDPMATGLLIVCVGKSTKIVDRYQGMTKGYSGIFRLGEATSTWDADSPVIQREPWEHVKDSDLKKAAESLTGEIWQVPPMFSAIKVGGEKLYEKARRGESLELSPRRISIFQFDLERSLNDRQNVIFRVICSKGTYIRSLCADLGKALGSCAHLTALRRDSIGEYLADDAWDFKELEEEIVKGYM